jgi:hypothetical protein
VACDNIFKKRYIFASTSPLGLKKKSKLGRIGLNAFKVFFCRLGLRLSNELLRVQKKNKTHSLSMTDFRILKKEEVGKRKVAHCRD